MSDESQPSFQAMFEDPERVRSYSDGPKHFTPGFADVHRMVNVLLQERAPTDARVLVHGAGGGLELEAMASANANWQFVGVDPAQPMLDAAEERLGELMERVQLHHGYIEDAPAGPFDAATSLLTLHFLGEAARIETIKQIVDRLKPGAPFAAVHSSFPQGEHERALWLSRYAQFAMAAGVPAAMAEQAKVAVGAMNTMYEPDQDLRMLEAGGLVNVATFYAAFTWRGWIGYAP